MIERMCRKAVAKVDIRWPDRFFDREIRVQDSRFYNEPGLLTNAMHNTDSNSHGPSPGAARQSLPRLLSRHGQQTSCHIEHHTNVRIA